MAEWSMAVVLKTTVPGRVPGVRIPLPPPTFAHARGARELRLAGQQSPGLPRIREQGGTNPEGSGQSQSHRGAHSRMRPCATSALRARTLGPHAGVHHRRESPSSPPASDSPSHLHGLERHPRRPLPVADQDRVVVLWGGSDGSVRQLPLTADHFERYRATGADAERSRRHAQFDRLAARGARWRPSAHAEPRARDRQLLHRARIGARARPCCFDPRTMCTGAAPVAMISDAPVARAFGGSADAIGRRLTVPARNLTYTVVGVAAPGLEYPARCGRVGPAVGIQIPEVVPLGTSGTWCDCGTGGRRAARLVSARAVG